MQVPIRKAGKYASVAPDPHLTPKKHEELVAELNRLKDGLSRAALEVKRLAEMGDLSENAAYSIAKSKLRGMEERILALERHLKTAVVITSGSASGAVELGCTVTIELQGKQTTYTILGSSETDPSRGIISHLSPIGSALMGHRKGDMVTLRSANDEKAYTIVNIA